MLIKNLARIILTALLLVGCMYHRSADALKEEAVANYTEYLEENLIDPRFFRGPEISLTTVHYRLNPRYKAYLGVCYYYAWDYENAVKHLSYAIPKLVILHRKNVLLLLADSGELF